jgi:hypothetical protein
MLVWVRPLGPHRRGVPWDTRQPADRSQLGRLADGRAFTPSGLVNRDARALLSPSGNTREGRVLETAEQDDCVGVAARHSRGLRDEARFSLGFGAAPDVAR